MPTNTKDLDNARRLAKLLDTAVGVPGTKLRLGLDALLGLIPGAGDAIGAALSGYIILAAARAGATRATLMRMVGNVAVDTLIGAIPLLGDLFDVAFKANVRNLALLERLHAEPAALDRGSRRLGVVMVVVLVLVLVGLVTLTIVAARMIWRLLTA